VFAPYTSIKTNVLFFEKGKATHEVWYYEHPYPEGYKSYSKTKPMRLEEFDQEKAWWNNRVESPFAWKVTLDQIRERGFNLDIQNPNAPGITHEDPDELLARFEMEKAATAALREQLRAVLGAALLREVAK
jgi:type I restriction enzyme M protein